MEDLDKTERDLIPIGNNHVATGRGTMAALIAAARRAEKLAEALDEIAEEHDAGRHDGLPEACPAHDDVTMWAIARAALAAYRKGE